jgi:hypothetical protein
MGDQRCGLKVRRRASFTHSDEATVFATPSSPLIHTSASSPLFMPLIAAAVRFRTGCCRMSSSTSWGWH